MRKIFLFVCSIFSIFLLVSCGNGENKEPVYEEPTYEDVMSVDSLNYIKNIKEIKIYPMVGYNEYVKYDNSKDITNFYSLIKNVSMNKNLKYDDNDVLVEEYYRYVLKDINEFISVNIADENISLDFYIGISGFIYYFGNDFYYQSSENIYYDLVVEETEINLFNSIFNLSSFYNLANISNIKLIGKDLEITLSDSKKSELINYLNMIDFCMLGTPVKDESSEEIIYVNSKCANGLEIKFDNLFTLKISKEGKLYLISNNVYTTVSINKTNFYDLLLNYFVDNYELPDVNSGILEESNLVNLVNVEATSITFYYMDGYEDMRLYNTDEKINNIFNILSQANMKKYNKMDINSKYYSEYHHALVDVYEDICLVIADDTIEKKVYVGASGYIYYFLDDCYYKSTDNCYDIIYDAFGIVARKPSKRPRLLCEHIYSSYENRVVSSITISEIDSDNKYEFTGDEMEEIITKLSNIELYFVSSVLNESDDEIVYHAKYEYYNNKKDGLRIIINYDNGKSIHVLVNKAGVVSIGSPLYMSLVYDKTNYYNLFTEYINDKLIN